MKKKLLLALTSVVALQLTGCATIFTGGSQTINLSTGSSEEVAAKVVTADGEMNVRLPQAISVPKSHKAITVTVEGNECAESTTTTVQAKLQPWFLGNILIGGLIGSTTDSISGAAWQYDSNVLVKPQPKDCDKSKAEKK